MRVFNRADNTDRRNAAEVKGLCPLRVIIKVAAGKLLGSIIAQQLPRRGETLNCAFISSAQEKTLLCERIQIAF